MVWSGNRFLTKFLIGAWLIVKFPKAEVRDISPWEAPLCQTFTKISKPDGTVNSTLLVWVCKEIKKIMKSRKWTRTDCLLLKARNRLWKIWRKNKLSIIQMMRTLLLFWWTTCTALKNHQTRRRFNGSVRNKFVWMKNTAFYTKILKKSRKSLFDSKNLFNLNFSSKTNMLKKRFRKSKSS